MRSKRGVAFSAVTAALALGGFVAFAANGPTTLPSGRAIVAPSGPVATVGTLPEGLALARGGELLVVEGGTGPAAVRILDAATLVERGVVTLKGVYGTPLVDDRGAWVAGGNADRLVHVDVAKASVDRTLDLPPKCWASAVARVNASTLAATCEQTDTLVLVDEGDAKVTAQIAVGPHPNAVLATHDGKRVFSTAWGGHGIDVVDVASARRIRTVGAGLHPSALALAPDERHLYVANDDDDTISIVDLDDLDRVPSIVALRLGGERHAVGNALGAFALDAARKRLYVAAGGANAVYVLGIEPAGGLRRIGAIPAGWFPTAVLATANAVYVANGLGERSRANPEYNPLVDQYGKGYIQKTDVGSVRKLPVPGDAALLAGEARVTQLAGPIAMRAHPIVRANGPIRHVIYIIRENRTYDQVFGDIAGGDGDPKLVLFGTDVTPNGHAIAERFGLFDHTYCNAQVSPDGHNWSMAAIANDYTERMWQAAYAKPSRRPLYDFESPLYPGRPHAGFLWDVALDAGLSLRNYGEFVRLKGATFYWEGTPAFVAHTDPRFPGYDTAISDLDRVAEWEREFREYERRGNLPALEIVRLPNDHTAGTRPGALTPQAYVAQNDFALGKMLDVVSHSRFWPQTAIFVIEDDAQDGGDHVDEHRTTFLLASPYARRGVHAEHYSTASVLRTIEIILGLGPMSTFDERALPMYAGFQEIADTRPYVVVQPRIDINAKNKATAYRAADSAKLDFDDADEVDAGTLNDILWHAIKGVNATPPPYGRFSAAR